MKGLSMTDENPTNVSPLAAALRGTLRVVENIDSTDDSPLREATADSINLLLDEINNNLADGMPERTTDEQLSQLMDILRAQSLTWATAEIEKQSKPRRSRKSDVFSGGTAIDVDLT